jgi:hypothetical protein
MMRATFRRWSPRRATVITIGLARCWHFLNVYGFIVTGIFFIIMLFDTDQCRRLVPQSTLVLLCSPESTEGGRLPGRKAPRQGQPRWHASAWDSFSNTPRSNTGGGRTSSQAKPLLRRTTTSPPLESKRLRRTCKLVATRLAEGWPTISRRYVFNASHPETTDIGGICACPFI